MSERLRVLDELGAELERAARRTLAQAPARRAWRLSPVLVVLLVLLLAAAAATATLLIVNGGSLPAPHAADLAPWENPVAGSVRLAGLDAPDPAGGPRWDLRLSHTSNGETCIAVGQVYGGRFGIIGLDRVFRAQPVGGVDACGSRGIAGPVLAGARVFLGRTARDARTVVDGVAGPGVRSVTAAGPGGPRRLRLGPDGSFLTVYRGYVEDVRPRIAVVTADGRTRTIAFATSRAFETPDPSNGTTWQASAGANLEGRADAPPDESCAQASQEIGRANPGQALAASLTPNVCGRLGGRLPLFVLMRRFDPGDGDGTGYPWGQNPARTLVYGAASLRVRRLVLLGAGRPRAVRIDPAGGAFVAVLDGRVDPRGLTLVAELRDGRRVRFTHSTQVYDDVGRAIDQAIGEPLRAPRPSTPGAGAPGRTLPGTLTKTASASDPAGGPPWRLQSWQAPATPQPGSPTATRFTCWQAGVARGGRLVQPIPGGRARTLAPTASPTTSCRGTDAGQATDPPAVATYPDDAGAYAPRPLRSVVTGVLPSGGRDAQLLGAGGPRPLTADANGAFVAVLPGSLWQAPLRVSVRLPDGRVVTSRPSSGGGPPVAAPQVRAPDPDGAAPWGYAVGIRGAWSTFSTELGRVIDGRIASLDPVTGTLMPNPGRSSSGTARQEALARQIEGGGPVEFDAGPIEQAPLGGRLPLDQAEIERRTLPGTTAITGRADPDVRSITLTTPRDVRTIEPTGPNHVFIVVYDGIFYRGASTATIQRRDGHTVTEPILGALGSGIGVDQIRPPTLTQRLVRYRAELRQMRAFLLHSPAGSSLHAQQERGVRRQRDEIQKIERRLAFEHAHPGVLPAER